MLGLMETVQGLVGLVSVYWLRQQVWSATSISVGHHIHDLFLRYTPGDVE